MKRFVQYCFIPCALIVMLWLAVTAASQSQEVDGLRQELALARFTAAARKKMLEETRLLQQALAENTGVLDVTVTAYNPTESQCDEDPFVTASMRPVRAGTIAVSRDLFDQGWVFGKKVRIEGLGIFEINDLMNARFTRRIDVFMWDEDEAVSFGARRVRAALLEI